MVAMSSAIEATHNPTTQEETGRDGNALVAERWVVGEPQVGKRGTEQQDEDSADKERRRGIYRVAQIDP